MLLLVLALAAYCVSAQTEAQVAADADRLINATEKDMHVWDQSVPPAATTVPCVNAWPCNISAGFRVGEDFCLGCRAAWLRFNALEDLLFVCGSQRKLGWTLECSQPRAYLHTARNNAERFWQTKFRALLLERRDNPNRVWVGPAAKHEAILYSKRLDTNKTPAIAFTVIVGLLDGLIIVLAATVFIMGVRWRTLWLNIGFAVALGLIFVCGIFELATVIFRHVHAEADVGQRLAGDVLAVLTELLVIVILALVFYTMVDAIFETVYPRSRVPMAMRILLVVLAVVLSVLECAFRAVSYLRPIPYAFVLPLVLLCEVALCAVLLHFALLARKQFKGEADVHVAFTRTIRFIVVLLITFTASLVLFIIVDFAMDKASAPAMHVTVGHFFALTLPRLVFYCAMLYLMATHLVPTNVLSQYVGTTERKSSTATKQPLLSAEDRDDNTTTTTNDDDDKVYDSLHVPDAYDL